MKSTKQIIITMLSMILLLTSLACLFSCNRNPIEEPLRKLDAPGGLRIEDEFLAWNPVEFASRYLVSINGNEYYAEETRYSLDNIADGDYSFKVRAMGVPLLYESSNYSQELKVRFLDGNVYFNFFNDKPTQNPDNGSVTPPADEENGDGENENKVPIGSNIGEKCPAYSLEIVNGNGEKVNIRDFEGKAVVVNFWGVWCGPCKSELPHFNELANEFADEVVFVIIHSVYSNAGAPAYVSTNFADSKMIFAYDLPLNSDIDMYFNLLGGTSYYPRTLVLNKEGIVTYSCDGAISYEALKMRIEKALK